MRDALDGKLEQLGTELTRMAALAELAILDASRALLSGDTELADAVLRGDAQVDRLRDACEDHAYTLIALQAPVASDLRAILAAVYSAVKIERMADLAAHIADLVRLAGSEPPVPADAQEKVAKIVTIVSDLAAHLHALVAGDAHDGFATMRETQLDVHQRCDELLAMARDPGERLSVRAATGLALLARFYERFVDQAVAVTRRLDFVATGAVPR